MTNANDISLAAVGFTFQLNGILRARLAVSEDFTNFYLTLDRAFRESRVETDLVLYRACNYKEMLRYIDGSQFIELGYMSTAKRPESTHRFFGSQSVGYSPALVTISVPAGTNFLDLEDFENFDNTTYEDEVLLKRNALFEISSHRLINVREVQDIVGSEIENDFAMIKMIEMKLNRYLNLF